MYSIGVLILIINMLLSLLVRKLFRFKKDGVENTG
jgi:hypothetical protein